MSPFYPFEFWLIVKYYWIYWFIEINCTFPNYDCWKKSQLTKDTISIWRLWSDMYCRHQIIIVGSITSTIVGQVIGDQIFIAVISRIRSFIWTWTKIQKNYTWVSKNSRPSWAYLKTQVGLVDLLFLFPWCKFLIKFRF